MRGFSPPKPAFRGLAEEEEDETVKVLVLSALQEALNSTPVQRQLVAALDLHTQLQAVFVESKHLLIQQLIADLNLGSRLTALLADRKIQEQMMTDSRRRRRDEEAEKQRDRRAQPADVPAGASRRARSSWRWTVAAGTPAAYAGAILGLAPARQGSHSSGNR